MMREPFGAIALSFGVMREQHAAAGGARTRAYEAMKAAVGKDLRAAFFRSQDGRTDFVKSVGPVQ